MTPRTEQAGSGRPSEIGGTMARVTETKPAPFTITKKELIDRIAEKTGEKRVVVKKIVQSVLDEVVNDLGEGKRLEFRDFGVFEVRERKARTAQNPKTLERVEVPIIPNTAREAQLTERVPFFTDANSYMRHRISVSSLYSSRKAT